MLVKQLRTAFWMTVWLTVLTGVLYPAGITVIAQAVFPRQANGSLITLDGKIVGSTLIGQAFDEPKYFWSRLSATTPPYNAASSSGSNLGPTNPALLDAVKARIAVLRQADPSNAAPVPVDLVTASGSGLDPHISIAAAQYQLPRVARVRGLSPMRVQQLVDQHTQHPLLGLIGEPVVNVLTLNLALDRLPKSG